MKRLQVTESQITKSARPTASKANSAKNHKRTVAGREGKSMNLSGRSSGIFNRLTFWNHVDFKTTEDIFGQVDSSFAG